MDRHSISHHRLPKYSERVTVQLMLLTLLAVWLGGVGYLYLSYQNQTGQYAEYTLDDVAQRGSLLALMQAELVDSKLTHYDRLLQNLQSQVSTQLANQVDESTLTQLLNDHARGSGALADLIYVDQFGDITAWTHEGPKPNVFDRDYFQVHRNTETNGRYLSLPVVARVDEGIQMVTISRPVFDAQGQWQGVLAAALNLEEFSKALGAITLNERIFSAVAHANGEVLLVTPYTPLPQGTMLPELPDTFDAGAPGTLEFSIPSEDVPRQVTHHPLQDWGLLVFVGEDLTLARSSIENFNQNQLQRALFIATVCTLLLLAVAWLLYQRLQSLRQLRAGEEQLHASHARNQAIINALPDLLVTVSADGTVIDYEAGQDNIELLPPEQFLGHSLGEILPAHLAESAQKSIDQALATGRVQTFEYSLKPNQQLRAHYEARMARLTDDRALVIILDITERKEAQDLLQWQATHDSLTRLPNRILFYDRLQQSINEQQRHNSRTFALLYLDLDGFKAVNDTLGHTAGDELLCQVAERLKTRLRASDTVARLAGDEFGVIVKQCARNDAISLAHKISKDLAAPYKVDEQTVLISASVGVAVCPDDGATPDALVKVADHAMYDTKHGLAPVTN